MKASVSTLSNFASCRRQWWLDQIYRSLVPVKPLWIGQVVHEGLDAYYRFGRDPEVARTRMEEFIRREVDRYAKDLPGLVDIGGELIPPAEDAMAYVHNYSVYDQANSLDGTVVDVEKSFKITLDSGDVVSGRIDLIMRSNRTGRLWVVDHKTMSSRPNLAGLDVDEQMSAYCWAAYRLYDEVPEKIIYNVILKNLPSEPTVLKRGGLSKDKSSPVVYDLYLAKIRELGLNEADYRDMLDYLENAGWSMFFERVESSRNLSEIETFERYAAVKLREIQRIFDNPMVEAYPSPSSFSCGYCAYLGACKAMNDGGDWEGILDARFAKW